MSDAKRCGVCGEPAVTVDMACGYRCAQHPPTYVRSYARDLARVFPESANAYRRLHIRLLRERIATRTTVAAQDRSAA